METQSPFPSGSAVVAYLRDSGADEQELSLAQQEKELRAWTVRQGIRLERIYRDTASGSSTVNRDQFHTMMADLRSGLDVAGLVVWMFSRLSRNINDAQFYRADLRRRGYVVHSIADNIPAGPGGQLMEAVIDWANQRHLEELSVGVKRGLNHLVSEYGAVPGNPPVGFKREKIVISQHRDGKPREVHRWIPDPDIAPRVKRAYELLLSGATNQEINDQCRLFKGPSNLRYMFSNPLFKGILVYSGQTYANYCEPVVDDQTWATAQLVLEKRADLTRQTRGGRDHPRRKGSSPEWLLNGLLFCAKCSTPLNINASKNWAAYVCGNAKRKQGCTAKAIPKDLVEQAVLETVRTAVLDETILGAVQEAHAKARVSQADELHKRLARLKTELADQRHKVHNLTEAVAAAGHSQALLQALEREEHLVQVIQEEVAEVEATMQAEIPDFAPDRLKEIVAVFRARIAAGRPEEVKRILQALVSRITIERVEKGRILGQVLYFHPGELNLSGPP